MKKNYKNLLVIVFAFLLVPFWSTFAQTDTGGTDGVASDTLTSENELVEKDATTLYFFHSVTCPHCREEQKFLDILEKKYPELTILRYEVSDPTYTPLMRQLAAEHDAERYLGNVPLTFVGEQYFVGYDNERTTGVEIERAVRAAMGIEGTESGQPTSFPVPFFGSISQEVFSLPVLAILLGFLDGFNVCSLGALVLIIGLSLKLQRRKSILLFGGTFIVTTALVYGALIVAWYHIFELFSGLINFMKVAVALIAFGGGIYFFKEYFRMRKQGPQCEFQESKLINTLMQRTGNAFENNTKLLGILGMVLLFAVVVAVVEFPCSAAVPVVFAGMLADAGLSTVAYLAHIALFVLFYMLDEIVIFGIAAYRLKLWMMSGAFTKHAVLAEALILMTIGLFYLGTMFGIL
ncbi:MAG: hypothetical protein UV60_C0009G0021 [Parcubacteria group bacterium GW2011_GWA2_43_11]|nr:MAG: hypothetical protein UU89_C0011G0008 [Parcubacteria group bacterium GW2011_GWC2_42_11]KKS85300.1 MAG: hypothetical protein UV60_C0009G0021 [Parcubacteria group bacterium GW2011_GWA2_43_11]